MFGPHLPFVSRSAKHEKRSGVNIERRGWLYLAEYGILPSGSSRLFVGEIIMLRIHGTSMIIHDGS
jgi:hypothetical protein